MLKRPISAWLRPAFALVGVAGMLTLAGCGGGSGAPNNPYVPPPVVPVIPTLTVLPDTLTVYSGVPATLTVTGGIPPYRAFTSNATALPVSTTLSGDTLVLVGNSVGAPADVTVTIQDSVNSTDTSSVTVTPAPLLPNLLTIVSNGDCPVGSVFPGNLCSGGTGTATVRVTSPTGAGIAGRQVRFDLVSGAYAIQSNNPAQPFVQTRTVTTDVNGNAAVGIAIPVDTPTQIAVLRATDVTSGNQVTGQFTIQQVVDGSAILSVIPGGNTTITGPLLNICSSGVRVTHYIFGGTPPYQVRVNFPDHVTLLGVPVMTSGGGFDTITNGSCFVNLTYAITDATGRTLPSASSPTVTNEPGTIVPTPPPAPIPVAPLVISPGVQSATNCMGKTFNFIVSGGTAPYSRIVSPSSSATIDPPTGNGSSITVTTSSNETITYSVSVVDSGNPQLSATATIQCTVPAP